MNVDNIFFVPIIFNVDEPTRSFRLGIPCVSIMKAKVDMYLDKKPNYVPL